MWVTGQQIEMQLLIQLVKRGAVTHGHVINLIHGFGVLRGGGEQVGLHHIGNKTEVAAGFAVAIDEDRFALDHTGGPLGYDGGISTVGVLAGPENVEVAQANGVKAIAAGKHVGIQLIDVFGNRVGAQGFANGVFNLGQAGVVAIGGAAGRKSKAFDFCVAGGNQHVEVAGDVGGVGGDGVFQATGDAAQIGLVQDIVDARAGFLAIVQVANVALDELETGPLLGGDQGLHFIQVALVAGGKVV